MNLIFKRLHERLFVKRDEKEYLIFTALGLIPVLAAAALGVGDNRVCWSPEWGRPVPACKETVYLTYNTPSPQASAPLPSHSLPVASSDNTPAVSHGADERGHEKIVVTGFLHKWNWVTYPLLLPLALFALGYLFRKTWGSKLQDHLATKYAAILKRTDPILSDGKALQLAFVASVIFHIFDKRASVVKFTTREPQLPQSHHQLDWGWMHLTHTDIGLHQVVAVDILATINQFILALLAFLALASMYQFNKRFLSSIYVKNRQLRSPQDETHYVLDFKDRDKRFGLVGFNHIFNAHLWIVTASGFFILLSRYANVELTRLPSSADFSSIASIWNLVTVLLPDIGQALLVPLWLILAWIALMPSAIKLLPRSAGTYTNTAEYLEQLVPDYNSQADQTGTQMRFLSDKFRENAFWPNGDFQAGIFIFLSASMGAIILFPYEPDSLGHAWIAVVSVIGFAYAFSTSYLNYHKFQLYRIGSELTDAPHLDPLILFRGK